ncbi:MAG: hypothetical protein DMF67_02735 [Acidobacteria bacterium]|nr:MAG: hypothetical protein DMF66_08800 [Acidobacteriota bacterium]PYS85060.1 MAG: hypothetical protein DMF67_02735 [Acidobacteriota bacterium]
MSLPFDMPAGLTPEARRELERWDEERRGLVAEIKRIPLRILVWGPSPASPGPVAFKRVQIRDALVAEGFLAVFSEIWAGAAPGLSQKTNELTQALTAHLIIILIEGSPGALAEMHDFSSRQDVARKMLVMCPRRYSDGYSIKGAGAILSVAFGNLDLYEDGEIENCNVLTRALARAVALREAAAHRELRDILH